MKWETIKTNCVRQMASENRQLFKGTGEKMLLLAKLRMEGYNKPFHKFNKEIEDKLAVIIENWDIRKWNDLKTVFPECFPNNIIGVALTDKGWELI